MIDCKDQDIEANAFAMELLMPEDFIRRDLEKSGGIDLEDDAAIARMAKRYRVTPAAMIVRLSSLNGGADV